MTIITTHFLLMGQYGCQAVIPLEHVVRDYFSHLTVDSFLRKIGTGEIVIPVIRADTSQKSQKGIHLADLADYLDKARDRAVKEMQQLNRR